MPEGPEIAREADQIRTAIADQEVYAIRFAFPELARRAASFEGARVVSVRAYGKAMLIQFDNALTIYSHNQLYGRWYVRKSGSLPKTNRQLRLAIEAESHWALLYSASEIEILDEAGLAFHPYLSKLGPDALGRATKPKDIIVRLEDRRFMGRGLGALLLDQSFVAGLGNYLRSEILFEARLYPRQRPLDLDAAARRRLAKAILFIAIRAYETKGVTLPKAHAAKLRRAGSSWSNARHWVFAREGEACRVCETPIERFALAGRRVYWCSVCQPPQAKAP